MTSGQPTGRKIGILLFPDVEVLDFAGPWEVFGVLSQHTGHQMMALAETLEPVASAQRLRFVPDATFAASPQLDVIIVPGGPGARADTIASAVDFVRTQAPGAEIVASVCTGAYVLQAAGLLEGKTVVTHWQWREPLRDLGVRVSDERYVSDGKIWTSAGVSAGIDMSLALVGHLYGEDVGRRVQHGIEYDPAPPFPLRKVSA